MEVFTEAGADERKLHEPVYFLRLKFVLAIDDANINLEAVFVLQQFFEPIIQLKERTNQNQALGSTLDHFFQEIVCGTGVQELRQGLCLRFLLSFEILPILHVKANVSELSRFRREGNAEHFPEEGNLLQRIDRQRA